MLPDSHSFALLSEDAHDHGRTPRRRRPPPPSFGIWGTSNTVARTTWTHVGPSLLPSAKLTGFKNPLSCVCTARRMPSSKMRHQRWRCPSLGDGDSLLGVTGCLSFLLSSSTSSDLRKSRRPKLISQSSSLLMICSMKCPS
jgi:hypothetical protein